MMGAAYTADRYFYPRPPRGGRLHPGRRFRLREIFLSTPSARRATNSPSTSCSSLPNFYPRPPRGGRPFLTACPRSNVLFLSTPSVRRATAHHNPAGLQRENFYPRPPRGGRPLGTGADRPSRWISIHALREEGDLSLSGFASTDARFLSTPSARRATYVTSADGKLSLIFLSTPSARRATKTEEADGAYHKNFYPRPPRGGRLVQCADLIHANQFLSTPSARRATLGL